MRTILNTLVRPGVGIVSFRTVLHTSSIYRLSKCAYRAVEHASPSCIISKMIIWARILTSFSYIITILFSRAISNAWHRNTTSKSNVECYWTLSNAFTRHRLTEIICYILFRASFNADSYPCRSIRMFESIIISWTYC